jgi:hypothetical protein
MIDLDNITDPEAAKAAVSGAIKTLHEQHAAGTRSLAEVHASAKKAAADCQALDAEVSRLKAADMARDLATRRDGADIELRHFKAGDTDKGGPLRLVGRSVQYRGQRYSEPGLLDSSEQYGEWHAEIKQTYESAVMCSAMQAGRVTRPGDAVSVHAFRKHAPKLLDRLGYLLTKAPAPIRAEALEMERRLFSDTASGGAEMIPDAIQLPELEKSMNVMAAEMPLVKDLIRERTMSGKNLTSAVQDRVPMGYNLAGAASADRASMQDSRMQTSEVDYSAKDLALRIAADRSALEDSPIDAMAALREAMIVGGALTEESLIFHGDTSGTHQDTGIASWNPGNLFDTNSILGGTADHRKMFLGLRARAADMSATTDLSTFDYSNLLALAGNLDAPIGMTPGGLVLAMGYETYFTKVLGLTETKTMDVYGANAGVLGGFVGVVGPWAIRLTPVLSKQYNASGIYDGATETKQVVVGFAPGRFTRWRRRSARFEIANDITTNLANMVLTKRFAFGSPDGNSSLTSASPTNVAVGYNI